MTVAPPTAADLKAAFPAFAAVSDATVTRALTRAARMVDSSWTDGDFAYAQELYACHVMTLDGFGTGAEAQAAAQGATGYRVMKSGSLSLERFDQSSGGDAVLQSTSWGRRFYELLMQNRGGPLTVGPAADSGVNPYARDIPWPFLGYNPWG